MGDVWSKIAEFDSFAFRLGPETSLMPATLRSCPTGKRAFATEVQAEEVLIDTRVRHSNDSHGPVGVYRCDDCGQFHLTSKGPMNARLAQYIKDGKLKLNQEAERWKSKFDRS